MENVNQNIKTKERKKNALVLCRDNSRLRTTQKQFWQWVREGGGKTGVEPLTGGFVRDDEEKMVVVANTVLNLACPNHLREALAQRRFSHHR